LLCEGSTNNRSEERFVKLALIQLRHTNEQVIVSGYVRIWWHRDTLCIRDLGSRRARSNDVRVDPLLTLIDFSASLCAHCQRTNQVVVVVVVVVVVSLCVMCVLCVCVCIMCMSCVSTWIAKFSSFLSGDGDWRACTWTC